MMRALLPPGVVTVGSFADLPDAPLFPEEERVIQRAVTKRRLEFATARWCARTALARLGIPPVPIVPGERGAPRWPAGVVGSITHCAGYRAAAVALATEISAIGIDAEPRAALPAEVVAAVASPRELASLAELARGWPAVPWGRLLFSAKESVYKAWFPVTARWLDFHDVEIVFAVAEKRFLATVVNPDLAGPGTPVTRFRGRWAVAGDLLATAIAVPTRPGYSAR